MNRQNNDKQTAEQLATNDDTRAAFHTTRALREPTRLDQDL